MIYSNLKNSKINSIMFLNLRIDKEITVVIRNKEYPVAIAGSGIPCLSIGIGTLGQRTLSQRFKKHFKVYSSDLYFDARFTLKEPLDHTIDHMVDDIAELGKQLTLSKFVIFGHSAFGLIALECAKKYPEIVSGIIMVGTPVNSNAEVAARNNHYFEIHASLYRKKIDLERQTKCAHEDFNSLDFSSRFLKNYIYRNSARYWHIADFDCSALWENIQVDPILEHLFSNLFPGFDVQKNIESVQCPIFLAAGYSDYDCCPFQWKEIRNLPPQMIISEFTEGGHWCHYEEQDLFDTRIEEWIKNL